MMSHRASASIPQRCSATLWSPTRGSASAFFFFFFLNNPPPTNFSPFPHPAPLPFFPDDEETATFPPFSLDPYVYVDAVGLNPASRTGRAFSVDLDLACGANAIFSDDEGAHWTSDRKSTRLNSSHLVISYAVFCLKKK